MEMNRIFKSQFALFLIYAFFLCLFIVVRPPSDSLFFWAMLAPVFIFGIMHMLRNRRDSKEETNKWNRWNKRLLELVDINDVNDDGHLFEWFDESDWELIFSELEKMPRGSRSLLKAINIIDPDFIIENA